MSKPTKDLLCQNYTLMGANGTGQMAKLINQLFCAAGFQLIAKAVKLAEYAGVKAEMIRLLDQTSIPYDYRN